MVTKQEEMLKIKDTNDDLVKNQDQFLRFKKYQEKKEEKKVSNWKFINICLNSSFNHKFLR